MAKLYYVDYQHVIRSSFLKSQKMHILALKVRLTCVVSVVHLRCKTYAFTKKCTTLTNRPVFSSQITVIFLPFKRFQLLDWLIFMTWFCNKKSKTAYRSSARYLQELFYISDGMLFHKYLNLRHFPHSNINDLLRFATRACDAYFICLP